MKSKAKPKKQDTEERKRKQITLTIDPDHYAFIKKAGFNASRFFDTAINALKTNTQHATVLIGAHPNPESLNEAKIEWTRRDSNTRSSPCEGDVITS